MRNLIMLLLFIFLTSCRDVRKENLVRFIEDIKELEPNKLDYEEYKGYYFISYDNSPYLACIDKKFEFIENDCSITLSELKDKEDFISVIPLLNRITKSDSIVDFVSFSDYPDSIFIEFIDSNSILLGGKSFPCNH